MVGQRLGVLVTTLVVALLTTASPALALPDCTSIGYLSCNIACYNSRGDGAFPPPQCTGWNVEACLWNQSQYEATYRYVCNEGRPITGKCDCDGDPGGGGCFLAGAPITMADGSTKPIEEIRAGDFVLAYDEIAKQMKPDKVREVHKPVEVPFYLVVNQSMKLTPNHRVLSKGEWVEIGQLAVGDTLTAPGGKAVPIEKIEKVEGKVTVYNFAVNPYETYVANGVIVHNKKHE